MADASNLMNSKGITILGSSGSIGVSTLRAGDAAFETLIQRADQALYHAKENGRNQTHGSSH